MNSVSPGLGSQTFWKSTGELPLVSPFEHRRETRPIFVGFPSAHRVFKALYNGLFMINRNLATTEKVKE